MKENFKLTLKVKTPVFIGNGESSIKKEYYYNQKTDTIHILNPNKFIQYIVKKRLINQYEDFMYNGKSKHYYLDSFARDNNISFEDIKNLTQYTLDASNIYDLSSLKEIKHFIRTTGKVYIPASSLKGALRTILLTKIIHDSNETLDNNMRAKEIEKIFLKDTMKGIIISDSDFIDDSRMGVFEKCDIDTNDKMNTPGTFRECIMPDTEVSFNITLNSRYLNRNIDINYIKDAVSYFSEFYNNTYVNKFKKSNIPTYDDFIVLGGGSGYFSKNIIYASQGYKKGLISTSEIMQRQFRKHGHELDIRKGISPHMLKCTECHNEYVQCGICTVSFSDNLYKSIKI